jgi:hypothetical protein
LTQTLYLTNQKPRFKGESREDFFVRAALAVDRLTDEQFATLSAKTRDGVNRAVKAANQGRSVEPAKPQDE